MPLLLFLLYVNRDFYSAPTVLQKGGGALSREPESGSIAPYQCESSGKWSPVCQTNPLTKSFQTDILITGPLYDLVQDEVNALYLGEHALRGREDGPTRLYSLIGFKHDDRSLYEQVHSELRHHLNS